MRFGAWFLLVIAVVSQWALSKSAGPAASLINLQDGSLIIILLAFVSISFGLGLLAGHAVFDKAESALPGNGAAQAKPSNDDSLGSEVSFNTQSASDVIIDVRDIEDPKASLLRYRIQSQGIFFD